METTHFQGAPIHTAGEIPAVGTQAPDFCLTKTDLSNVTLDELKGKVVVLNIFPSVDTPVCAASVRKFNVEATQYPDTVVLCISMDLPFAQARFCAAEGIDNVVVASAFRSPEFAKEYGLEMVDGPLKGLLARAVIILDKDHKVAYRELVNEITNEPDYAAATSEIEKLTK